MNIIENIHIINTHFTTQIHVYIPVYLSSRNTLLTSHSFIKKFSRAFLNRWYLPIDFISIFLVLKNFKSKKIKLKLRH